VLAEGLWFWCGGGGGEGFFFFFFFFFLFFFEDIFVYSYIARDQKLLTYSLLQNKEGQVKRETPIN
jgi:hypothetical protein